MKEKKTEVVTLVYFDEQSKAEIARSLLASADIQSFIVNDMIQAMLPSLSSGMEPIKLLVNSDDAQAAAEILKAEYKD